MADCWTGPTAWSSRRFSHTIIVGGWVSPPPDSSRGLDADLNYFRSHYSWHIGSYPRGGPLRGGQTMRGAGVALLDRISAQTVRYPPRRDRVCDRRHALWRLRADAGR